MATGGSAVMPRPSSAGGEEMGDTDDGSSSLGERSSMVRWWGMNSETGLHGFKSQLTCCVAFRKLTNLSVF